jgi:hypothetical protein
MCNKDDAHAHNTAAKLLIRMARVLYLIRLKSPGAESVQVNATRGDKSEQL